MLFEEFDQIIEQLYRSQATIALSIPDPSMQQAWLCSIQISNYLYQCIQQSMHDLVSEVDAFKKAPPQARWLTVLSNAENYYQALLHQADFQNAFTGWFNAYANALSGR